MDMKRKRLQVVLPNGIADKFDNEVKKQGRTASNLARKYIVDGLSKDEQKPENK